MTIELIPYQASVLEPFIEWRSQPSSVQHNPLKEMTRAEIAKRLESEGSELSDLGKYEAFRWFVQCDGVVVGNVSLKNINHMMNYAEIGYGISELHQRRGIATTAVRQLIDKAFLEAGLRKLIAYVHEGNLASCRVLEKLGFRREGLLREHYIINGVPENQVLFGLLKHDRTQPSG